MFKLFTLATGLSLFAIASSGSWSLASPIPPNPDLWAQSTNPTNPTKKTRPAQSKRGEMFQQLNLTNQQKQQISTIRQKYQKPIRELREQQRVAQNQLEQLMVGTGSESAIRDKNQEVFSLMQKIGNLRLNSMLEMRKVLTLEQRSQLSQLIKTRPEQRGRRQFGQGLPPTLPPAN